MKQDVITHPEREAVDTALPVPGPAGEVDISIVIPMQNEEPNVARLCAELLEVMDRDERSYEVIVINDGSTDGTGQALQRVIGDDSRFTMVEFTRNFGQSAAMSAGFRLAQGRVIVPMDGDLQNDPRDIPGLVDALDEPPGYDLVSGWRKNRKDKWLSRRLPSILANGLIRKLTWCEALHDFGCTLKAYRRDTLEEVTLYGEMHRFLPAMCRWRGARLTEKVVNHRPRIEGSTKYGLKRTFKVMLDLITVKFLGDYLTKPLYFFGKLAFVVLMMALASVGIALVQRFGYLSAEGVKVHLNDSIFILFGMMTFITSVVLVMMGLLSELLIRIYHESQGRMPYRIRRIVRNVRSQ